MAKGKDPSLGFFNCVECPGAGDFILADGERYVNCSHAPYGKRLISQPRAQRCDKISPPLDESAAGDAYYTGVCPLP